MLKRAVIFLLLLPLGSNYLPAEQFRLQDFSGGLVDRFTADRIADKYSPDLLNVYIDKDSGITKRRGYIKYLSTALTEKQKIRRIHTYPKNNGTNYMLFNSSWSVYYSQGAGDWTSIVSGKNSAYTYAFANALDYVYGSNGNDNMFRWDGSTYLEYTVTNSTNVPKGKYMLWYKNRLWMAGVTGTLSTLYYSQLLDPPNFGIVATDNMEYISQDDGDYITGLWGMEDVLLIFKRYSVWGLYGTAPSNWVIRCIDSKIGCLYQSSIASYNGYPTWLSREGIMQFDGVKLTRISDGIYNTIRGLRQTEINKRYVSDTNQEDFAAGTELIAVDTFTSTVALLNANIGTTNYAYPTIQELENSDATDVVGYISAVTNANTHYQTFKSSASVAISKIRIHTTDGGAAKIFMHLVDNASPNTIIAQSTSVTTPGDGWREMTFDTVTLTTDHYYRIKLHTNVAGSLRYYKFGGATDRYVNGGAENITGADYLFQTYGQKLISRFTSQIHNAGTNWKQWGLFQESHTKDDGTSINYYFRASTFSGGIALATFTAISNSYDITSTTGPFIQWRSSTTASSYSIDDVTINWADSAPVDDPVGISYDNRYWLAIATDSVIESNNAALIYNNNQAFTFFNNINVGSACLYKDKLYTGSAISDGMIYRQDAEGIYSDDGTDYDSYYTTKIFDMNNPFTIKLYRAMYLSAENSGNWNINVEYRLNGSTSAFTTKAVSLNVSNKTLAKKIPFQIARRGQYIQFRFRNSTANQYFGVKRFDCLYEGLPLK